MAAASAGSSHLDVTDNQKRWLVAGIALNKVVVPQIRPFVEQEVMKEYNNLKTSHNIHVQTTSGRLQRWPPRKFLKYENINGNDAHPKLPGGKYNYSLFDCRVLTHIDFARLYVENYMAKFNAFDEHCDASAVLLLLGGVPVFSAAVQAVAGDVRMARNDWAHCVFSKWDQAKFQQSFIEMEDLVRTMALPTADEGKIITELNDWENKGTQLCMNSPLDPALLQLVQQEVKSLQDDVKNMSVEFEEGKIRVQHELERHETILEEMKQRVQRLEDGVDDFQGDTNQRIKKLESAQQNTDSRTDRVENRVDDFQVEANQRLGLVEDQVNNLQEKVDDLTVKAKESTSNTSCQESPILMTAVTPENLVDIIRRNYKGAVLCPFPWCEDELQLELSNIFTWLQIVSKEKERAKLTGNVNMTEVFRPHAECAKPRVVLIEGDPGMGKTTYCQKLAYDWSVGEIPAEASFPKVEILLLLKCRDVNSADIKEAIDDQLLPLDVDEKEKENFFNFIHSNQSSILLVLDGLDELRQDLFHGFLPLIQGKVFVNTHVMLTARHEAGKKVRRYCDTLLEIVGYTHNDADSYILKYFNNHEDPSLAEKMIKKLQKDGQLRELTANPLNTALLCLLCEETGGVFPYNRTEMYDALVSCGVRRYFAKRSVCLGDDNPIERCTDQLNHLGKMALQALLKDQLYFSQSEMKCQSTDFLQLCFLSREPSVSKITPIPCYAFTHKTFQEYFAAFYLAHQLVTGDERSKTFLAQLSPVDNWQVWEFLLMMMASKSGEMTVFLVSCLSDSFHREIPENIIDAIAETDVNLDDEICDYESYDWFRDIEKLSPYEEARNDLVIKTLHLIAECENIENELKDYQEKMVLELSRCFPVYELKLVLSSPRYCHVYSEYLKANRTLTDLLLLGDLNELSLETIKHVFHPKHKLVHFNLVHSFNPFAEPLICLFLALGSIHLRSEALAWIIQSGRFLTHLNLSSVWVFDEGVQALLEALQTNRTLTHLNLAEAMIHDPGATAIADILQRNCTLTHLSLPKNFISGGGAEALARGLQRNHSLVYLDLGMNLGSDSVALALTQALESKCALSHLNLSQCFHCIVEQKCIIHFKCEMPSFDSDNVIGPSGASALARALQSNCTLTYLDLTFNRISPSGAAALGEALKSNYTLTHLYLMDNEIGESGAESLGEALQSNHTLTHLNLQCNRIGDSGAQAFAKALQSTGIQLTHLDLSFNVIGAAGVVALAEALQFNCSLLRLGLADNDFGDRGAIELAQVLQFHNNTLICLDLRSSHSVGALGVASLEQVDQSSCFIKYGPWRCTPEMFAKKRFKRRTCRVPNRDQTTFSVNSRNSKVDLDFEFNPANL